jgi:VanZ family protein
VPIGLRSNFLLGIVAVSLLLAVGVVVTAVISRRAHASRRSVARGLAVVSLLAIVVATVTPRGWPPQRDGWGDLVLAAGHDTLGQLGVLRTDPTSLAAVLIVLNVALFVPFATLAVLGWGRPGAVLLVALAVSVTIETIQFVALSRIASTDDVILNIGGAVVGACLGSSIAHSGWGLGPSVGEPTPQRPHPDDGAGGAQL